MIIDFAVPLILSPFLSSHSLVLSTFSPIHFQFDFGFITQHFRRFTLFLLLFRFFLCCPFYPFASLLLLLVMIVVVVVVRSGTSKRQQTTTLIAAKSANANGKCICICSCISICICICSQCSYLCLVSCVSISRCELVIQPPPLPSPDTVLYLCSVHNILFDFEPCCFFGFCLLNFACRPIAAAAAPAPAAPTAGGLARYSARGGLQRAAGQCGAWRASLKHIVTCVFQSLRLHAGCLFFAAP